MNIVDAHEDVLDLVTELEKQVATLTRERDEARFQAQMNLVNDAQRDREAALVRERDEAREINRKLLDATRVDCDVHHGARRECGQCYDSQGQCLKNVTAERDEARADAARTHEAFSSRLARTCAALSEALIELRENALNHDHHSRDVIDRRWRLEESMRAALADTTSDSWLAEVRATARDEALEEAADCFGMTADQERIRALKRGGK